MGYSITVEKDSPEKSLLLGAMLKSIPEIIKLNLPRHIEKLPYTYNIEGGVHFGDLNEDFKIFPIIKTLSFINLDVKLFNLILTTIRLGKNKMNELSKNEIHRLLSKWELNPRVWDRQSGKYKDFKGNERWINLKEALRDLIIIMESDNRYDPDFDLDNFVENEYDDYIKEIESKVNTKSK